MSRGDVILRLVELTKVYTGKRTVTALNNISTSFKRGEFVAVVGRSGSGKSTLINILGGLDQPSKGDYYCEGNNVSRLNEGHWDALRNKKIGFIFQNYFLIEYLSVYQNVEVALQFQNVPQSMKDAKIKSVVEKVGLIDHINKLPSQLSGGQRQRVAIARALVKDPDIILADEPTGALDWRTADEVIKLLKGESEDRLVVMVTHDRSIANKYANRIIEIENGNFKQDLIKEEIEQTYQNVFRKIKAVSLKKRDKFIMTFNKLRTSFVRNFFIALSLALAFSFSVLFNGLDRGVRDSYYSYYETLDKLDSNSFSVISNKDDISVTEFNSLNQRIVEKVSNKDKNDIVLGVSKDVISYNGTVYPLENLQNNPDLLEEYNIRLLSTNFNKYDHDFLFVNQSSKPVRPNTLMTTSKFIKEYFDLNTFDDIDQYIGKEITVPTYSVSMNEKLVGVENLLNQSSINGHDIRFVDTKVPNYCMDKESLDPYYLEKCSTQFDGEVYNNVFASYDDYLDYIDYFKQQINDPTYFELLKRSDAIYYLSDISDENYISNVYNLINKDNLEVAFYIDKLKTVKLTISGIIDNQYESIIYMTDENYNNLFTESSQEITYINSMYTINYINNDRDHDNSVFEILSRNSYEFKNVSLISHDKAPSNEDCSPRAFDDAKISQNNLFKSIFYVNDYNSCGTKNVASSYLNMINGLFSTFFNILMIASVVFYSMLIKVIFKARINEIGVFRSVGSTIKDIKRLFLYEVIYIFTSASILTFVILLLVKNAINNFFFDLTTMNSPVLNFSNIHLLISDNKSIINISYVNLLVQIVVVVALIMYISNKSISKVVNTNPIDILREVV